MTVVSRSVTNKSVEKITQVNKKRVSLCSLPPCLVTFLEGKKPTILLIYDGTGNFKLETFSAMQRHTFYSLLGSGLH